MSNKNPFSLPSAPRASRTPRTIKMYTGPQSTTTNKADELKSLIDQIQRGQQTLSDAGVPYKSKLDEPSFWDKAFGKASAITSVAPQTLIYNAVNGGKKDKSVLDELAKSWSGDKDRMDFSKITGDALGWNPKDPAGKVLKFAADFAGEVGTDWTTWATFGLSGATKAAAKEGAVKLMQEGITKGALDDLSKYGLKYAPDLFDEAGKAVRKLSAAEQGDVFQAILKQTMLKRGDMGGIKLINRYAHNKGLGGTDHTFSLVSKDALGKVVPDAIKDAVKSSKLGQAADGARQGFNQLFRESERLKDSLGVLEGIHHEHLTRNLRIANNIARSEEVKAAQELYQSIPKRYQEVLSMAVEHAAPPEMQATRRALFDKMHKNDSVISRLLKGLGIKHESEVDKALSGVSSMSAKAGEVIQGIDEKIAGLLDNIDSLVKSGNLPSGNPEVLARLRSFYHGQQQGAGYGSKAAARELKTLMGDYFGTAGALDTALASGDEAAAALVGVNKQISEAKSLLARKAGTSAELAAAQKQLASLERQAAKLNQAKGASAAGVSAARAGATVAEARGGIAANAAKQIAGVESAAAKGLEGVSTEVIDRLRTMNTEIAQLSSRRAKWLKRHGAGEKAIGRSTALQEKLAAALKERDELQQVYAQTMTAGWDEAAKKRFVDALAGMGGGTDKELEQAYAATLKFVDHVGGIHTLDVARGGEKMGTFGNFYVPHYSGDTSAEAMKAAGLGDEALLAERPERVGFGRKPRDIAAAHQRDIPTIQARLEQGQATNTFLPEIQAIRGTESRIHWNVEDYYRNIGESMGTKLPSKAEYNALRTQAQELKRAIKKAPDDKALAEQLAPIQKSLDEMKLTLRGNKGKAIIKSGDTSYAVSNELAKEISSVVDPLRDPAKLTRFHKFFSKVNGAWRRWATVYNPGFPIRNFQSNIYMAWTKGFGSVKRWDEAIRIATGKLDDAATVTLSIQGKPTTMNVGELKKLMQELGITGASGRVAEVSYDTLVNGPGKLDKALSGGKLGQKASDFGTAVNTGAEEIGRTAVFLQAYERTGSVNQAADLVRKTLYDYDPNSLTRTERGIRELIPFYTFTRRNLPEMVDVALHDPSRITVIDKLQKAGKGTLDEQFDPRTMPAYMKDMAPIPIQIGKQRLMLNPNWGFQDLAKLENTIIGGGDVQGAMRDLMATVTPLVKIPLEVGLNVDSFYGGSLHKYTDSLSPAPYPMQKMDEVFRGQKWWESVIKATHAARSPEGKFLVSPEFNKVYNTNPFFSGIGRAFEPGPQNPWRAISWAAGVKMMPVEQQKWEQNTAYAKQQEMADLLRKMRDEGKVKRAK